MGKKKKLPVNVKDPHRWYYTSHPQAQQNYWNFFVKKKGIPVEKMVHCMDKYLQGNPEKMRGKKYVLEGLYCDFDRLLSIVTQETGVTFGKKRKVRYDTTEIDNAFSLGYF
ncbi:hypothetical protein ACE38W_14760 [Chitinophaga sp. Hz27]|uniref:hypothetical protein n=1 Tax=Chitinophaga sp. Hz27 TaxID=3347169 RepID=UPI0035D71FFB